MSQKGATAQKGGKGANTKPGSSKVMKKEAGAKPKAELEKHIVILERECMMLRKNLDIVKIQEELKKSGIQENGMNEMFRESLHYLQLKLQKYESSTEPPVSGDLSAVQKELANAKDEVKKLKQKQTEMEKRINDKDNDLEAKDKELQTQKENISHSAKSRESIDKLQSQINTLNDEITQKDAKIKEQSGNIERLKNDLSEAKRPQPAVQEETISKIAQENTNSAEDHTTELNTLKILLAEKQEECQQLEKKLQGKIKSLEEITSSKNQLEARTQTLITEKDAEVSKLQKALDAKNKNTEQLENKGNNQTTENDDERSKLRDLVEEKDKSIEQLKVSIAEKDKAILDLQSETEGLQKEDKDINGLKDEIAKANENVEKIKGEKKALENDLEKIRSEKETLENDLKTIKLEKKALEKECSETSDKLSKKQSEIILQKEKQHNELIKTKDDMIQKLRREKSAMESAGNRNDKTETKGNEKTENELRKAREEIEELKNRLSKVVGANIMNDNPNIADLSDENRPTKLSEKFSELYDNEWTDAYEEVENDIKPEKEAVGYLYKTLQDVFEFCKSMSEEHAKKIRACVLTVPSASSNGRPKSAQIGVTNQRQLKELRKAFAPYLVDSVFQHFLGTKKINVENKKKTEAFLKKCVEICWLMNAQDPPVILDKSDVKGKAFDGDKYRTYTKSGKVVDYVVWPPMLLHKDGPLLCKGVAQGK